MRDKDLIKVLGLIVEALEQHNSGTVSRVDVQTTIEKIKDELEATGYYGR